MTLGPQMRPSLLTSGTPIPVALGTITPGIDFALDRLGALGGTVTDVATGEPISGLSLDIWDENGFYADYAYTDGAGQYRSDGLETGSYFVTTGSYSTWANELYDDLPCPGGGYGGCDVTAGTPIAVNLGDTTGGIDFELVLRGTLSGTVTEATSGLPAAGLRVEIWNGDGSYAGSDYTDDSGHYQSAGLQAGQYFVTTDSADHADELYDDLPCEAHCDVTAGTPVTVALATTTGGIDFELVRQGSISGRMTEAGTGLALANVRLRFWDTSGNQAASTRTDASGEYGSGPLAPGSYFVTTHTFTHANELYDDLPCPGDGICDVTAGTPVPVTLGATTGDIDFELTRLGAIAGRVVDAFTGAALYGWVEVWSAGGYFLQDEYLEPDGTYRVEGLEPGTYFVNTAIYYGGYIDELYDDLPCPGGACDVATGTPVSVSLATTTPGIDFALEPTEVLAGRVTDAQTGAPVPGVAIDVWSQNGAPVASTATAVDGRYHLPLDPGNYFVSTDNGHGGLDEVYDDLPCPAGPAHGGFCDPTAGTAVTVSTSGPAVTGIDFDLLLPIFADGFENGSLSRWSAAVGTLD